MGTINYKTSEYITMGLVDGLDEFQQIEIYNDVKNLLMNYDFYYYYVTLEMGYYNGFSIYIENNFSVAYDTYYDKKDARKEITQLKKFLLECANFGLVVCFPGWSTGYITDTKEIRKEIRKAAHTMKCENIDIPTWLWYERNQY